MTNAWQTQTRIPNNKWETDHPGAPLFDTEWNRDRGPHHPAGPRVSGTPGQLRNRVGSRMWAFYQLKARRPDLPDDLIRQAVADLPALKSPQLTAPSLFGSRHLCRLPTACMK